MHRILNTRVSARAAQASGAAAVALSQTLGFGLIVGTLARWRGLHRLDLAVASKVTALVSISFLGAWLTLFALSGVSETLCMRVSPCGFDGSFVEQFWV